MASSSRAAPTRPLDRRRKLPTAPFLFLVALLLLLLASSTSAFEDPYHPGGYGGGGWGGQASYYSSGDGGYGGGGGGGGGGGEGGGGWGYGFGSGGSEEGPWVGFYNYSGCQMGETRPGLAQVKQYLRQFGYFPTGNSPLSDDFDGDFESAVRQYQEYFGLNVTGTLDNTTVELMVQPRCGMADRQVNGTAGSHQGRGLYAYFPGNPVWPSGKTSLTYAFAPSTLQSPPIQLPVLRAVFKRAFARWAEVTKLTFTEVDPQKSSTPDLIIGFFSGNHGDGEPFDGPLGTLAHAFSPTDGRFHLDASEIWTAVELDEAAPNLLTTTRAIDLESVAVHEIGHLLGLGHSAVPNAIMYPTIRAQSRRVQLTDDDIKGIQTVYGNNPTFNGTSSFKDGTNTLVTNSPSVASAADSELLMMLPLAVHFLSAAAVLLHAGL